MRTAAYNVDVASDRRRRKNVKGTIFVLYFGECKLIQSLSPKICFLSKIDVCTFKNRVASLLQLHFIILDRFKCNS